MSKWIMLVMFISVGLYKAKTNKGRFLFLLSWVPIIALLLWFDSR